MKKAGIIAFIIVFATLAKGLMGQNTDKPDTDPAICAKYQSLYQNFYQQGDYQEALPWWTLAIHTCPRCSENLYIQGIKIFEERIRNEPDADLKCTLVDSLLWVYDERITYFGNHSDLTKGYLLGMKGTSIVKYCKRNYQQAYPILAESIGLMGSQSSAPVILVYMQVSRQLFKTGVIDDIKISSDYRTVLNIANVNLIENPDDENFKLAKRQIEIYFKSSGVTSGQDLTKLQPEK